jgi:hypothetical protein
MMAMRRKMDTIMDNRKDNSKDMLYQMLDRGIDDMEQGRELPVNEAFDKISELREIRTYIYP